MSTYDIKGVSSSTVADYELLNYLRTQVEINSNKISIADLIVISVKNNNYEELIQNTRKIFEKNGEYYSIFVYDEAKYVPIEKGEKIYWTPSSAGLKVEILAPEGIASDDIGQSEIIIPTLNQDVPLLKIIFLYGEGRPLTEREEIGDMYKYGGI